MAAKTFFCILAGYAMIICTLAATCPSVTFEKNYDINNLTGTWYLQAQHVYPTGLKEQLYCHKAVNTVKNNELLMNSNVETFCKDKTFVMPLRFVPNTKTGGLTLYTAQSSKGQPCYIITGNANKNFLLYCCNDCGSARCESLMYFTDVNSMDIDLIDQMRKKAESSGLKDVLPKVEYLSADGCYDDKGTRI